MGYGRSLHLPLRHHGNLSLHHCRRHLPLRCRGNLSLHRPPPPPATRRLPLRRHGNLSLHRHPLRLNLRLQRAV